MRIHPGEDPVWIGESVTVAVIPPYGAILKVDHIHPDVKLRHLGEGAPRLWVSSRLTRLCILRLLDPFLEEDAVHDVGETVSWVKADYHPFGAAGRRKRGFLVRSQSEPPSALKENPVPKDPLSLGAVACLQARRRQGRN